MWKKQEEQDCLADAHVLGRDGVQHDGAISDIVSLTSYTHAVHVMLYSLLLCDY